MCEPHGRGKLGGREIPVVAGAEMTSLAAGLCSSARPPEPDLARTPILPEPAGA
ncbi:hypothetical protein AB0N05_15575 [Nocardia sp. NPDC051030]|uniref:hypothetical protein n=1 Tax=Nocardia sp. NPDC051030 TaxID=3155162 RepID=UPI00342F9B39